MALHDYACGVCDYILHDVYRSAAEGATAHPPDCPVCGAERMDWIPAIRLDVGGVKGAAFKAFDVDVDGRATRIDSLHTLRRVERESEQRYRNGEGEPLRFRGYSQDPSNKDVGCFGTAGKIGEQVYDSGQPAPQRKPAKIDIRRHGERKPRISVAPHGGVSPLKDS